MRLLWRIIGDFLGGIHVKVATPSSSVSVSGHDAHREVDAEIVPCRRSVRRGGRVVVASQIGRVIIVPLRSRPGTSMMLVGVFDLASV
jgi:hypothetical protein